jgi:tetratricopeptide (TPR) repeat protein
VSSLLAVGCVLLSIALMTGLRSHARHAALRKHGEQLLFQARTDLPAGNRTIDDLVRLVAATESESWLSDLHARAAILLEQLRSRRDAQHEQDLACERLQEFRRLRDEALFQDTQIIGFNVARKLSAIRNTTAVALQIFAADGRNETDWKMGPLPASLSEADRDEITRGCYELLLILAEAIARPLPDESRSQQVRKALKVLDRANELHRSPTQAYHLRRAACLEKAGNLAAAKEERVAAERMQPDGACDQFSSGLERHERGEWTQAKIHFEAALRAQPNFFWAECLLAICELNSRPSEALAAKAHLTGCLKSHPELSWLYLLRGFAAAELGARSASRADAAAQFAAAEDDYRAAAERDPGGRFRYALLANRGLLNFQRGRLDDAVADLKEAISVAPEQVSAFVTLAQVEHHRGKIAIAHDHLTRAISLEPNLAPLYRTRARWNLEQRNPSAQIRAAALADLREAVRLSVANSRELAKDYAEMGRVLLTNREFQSALDACEAALRIDPRDRDVHRWRVAALVELKRDQEAIVACDAYLRAGQPSADLLGLRGLAKARRNDFPGAIDDYTLALALRSNETVLRGRRGWAYLVSGAPQLALRDFEEAIRLDPSSADSFSGRGSAHIALGHFSEAVVDAEESLRHETSDARIYFSAARILAQAGEMTKHGRHAGDLPELSEVARYQFRALSLLGQAIEHTSPSERDAFWRTVVHSDQALQSIRKLPAYAQLAAAAAAVPALGDSRGRKNAGIHEVSSNGSSPCRGSID